MDLPSDSDESDVDFVPEGEVSNSEAESEADADKETEEQYENELAKKTQKRTAKSSKKRVKKKTKLDNEDEVVQKPKENKVETLDPEQSKKYEDDLWASFLGTPSQSSSSKSTTVDKKESSRSVEDVNECDSSLRNGREKTAPDIEEKDLNGDEKKVTPSTGIPAALNKGRSSLPPSLPLGKRPGGGLASVLNKIGKKDKLSTLEKSKLDWMSFKKDEGIDEEIQTHNRGKAGYLERQDFLQRADLRQFEIEKNLRLNKRSSR